MTYLRDVNALMTRGGFLQTFFTTQITERIDVVVKSWTCIQHMFSSNTGRDNGISV
jgi:hypothetical protein